MDELSSRKGNIYQFNNSKELHDLISMTRNHQQKQYELPKDLRFEDKIIRRRSRIL